MTKTSEEKLAKQRAYMAQRNAKAAATGRCNMCLKRKARKDKLTCRTCGNRKAAWCRDGRARKKAKRELGRTYWLARVYWAARAAWRAGHAG